MRLNDTVKIADDITILLSKTIQLNKKEFIATQTYTYTLQTRIKLQQTRRLVTDIFKYIFTIEKLLYFDLIKISLEVYCEEGFTYKTIH